MLDLALGLSIAAIAISVATFSINYLRSRKTEQLKICIDITNRLYDAKRRIVEIEDKMNRNTTDQKLIEELKINVRNTYLSYLNNWNFFSFLVNIDEIHDKKILAYYKLAFKLHAEACLDEYPDVRDDKAAMEEIKKLLKKWDPDYYLLHFEAK